MTVAQWFWVPVAGLAAWLALAFNALVRSRNRAQSAWAQVDVQLRRRHDLVPNLVKVVSRYLQHEQETLAAVTRARAGAAAAEKIPGRALAENQLSGSLRSLLLLAEGYPELKAHQGMRDLMEQLTTTENRIAFARQHYNDSTLNLNNRIGVFPSSIVARLFGFTGGDYFELERASQGTLPAVDLRRQADESG